MNMFTAEDYDRIADRFPYGLVDDPRGTDGLTGIRILSGSRHRLEIFRTISVLNIMTGSLERSGMR